MNYIALYTFLSSYRHENIYNLEIDLGTSDQIYAYFDRNKMKQTLKVEPAVTKIRNKSLSLADRQI